MWKVFPQLGLLKLVFFVFSLILCSLIIIFLSPNIPKGEILSWNSFLDIIKLISPATILFLTIVFIFGKWAWKLLWNCSLFENTLNKNVCPNLNGSWDGTIESNFNIKQEKGSSLFSVNVELKIEADLFGFKIELKSKNDYQSSKVIYSEIEKDKKTGTYYIYYLFEAIVPHPKYTDDKSFDGAGKLEIIFTDSSDIILKGHYWTNRAYQRGLNTAGSAIFHRQSI